MFLLPWSLSLVGKSLVSPGICDRILSSVQRSRTGNGTGSGRTLPDALVRSWSRGEVEVLQQRRKSLCQSLLLFRMATVFALSFVHLFWICFEGWDPPLHWGNCSCFWWMQILDDSLDFIGSSRPDCKPFNQAPLEKTPGNPAVAQSRAGFMSLCSWGLTVLGYRSLTLSGLQVQCQEHCRGMIFSLNWAGISHVPTCSCFFSCLLVSSDECSGWSWFFGLNPPFPWLGRTQVFPGLEVPAVRGSLYITTTRVDTSFWHKLIPKILLTKLSNRKISGCHGDKHAEDAV